jgi:RNA polymerase sigma-70 factor (ECF subfamily)
VAQSASERERSFVALYERHYGSVLTYARRRTDEASARDVAAETFTVAWRRSGEVTRMDLPWLLRTAALVLANQQRSGRRQQRTADRLAAQPRQVAADPSTDRPGPARVARALDALSPDDRELLQLVAWERLSTSGLAAVLGCTSGTAAVRLHRARRRLRAALDAADDSADHPAPAATPRRATS